MNRMWYVATTCSQYNCTKHTSANDDRCLQCAYIMFSVPSVQIGSERKPWSYKHFNMRIERNVVVFFSLFLFLFFATSLFVIHYLLLSALSCCLLAKRLSMFVMCVEQSQLRFEKSEGTYVTILSSICERLVCSLCPMAKTNQNVIEVLRQMERDENKTVFLDWSTCKKKEMWIRQKKKKPKSRMQFFTL